MPVFILCYEFPDGAMKTPETMKQIYGKTWWMPRPQWIQDMLRTHGGDNFLKSLVRNERRIAVCKAGNDVREKALLLRVEAGHCYNGTLTPCWREGLFLFQHHMQPLDAFTLQIKGRILVDESILSMGNAEAAASVRKKSLLFSLGEQAEVYPWNKAWRCGSETELTSQQAAKDLGVDADVWPRVVASNLCCMWFPEPLLHLMKRSAWTTVMCQGRSGRWLQGWRNSAIKKLFESGLAGFPDATWIGRLTSQGLLCSHIPPDQTRPSTLSPSIAANVAGLLRRFATRLLPQLSEDDREDAEMNMVIVVKHLDQLSDVCRALPETRIYEPTKVIRSILVALSVRDVSDLSNTVWNGLMAAFPHFSKQAIQHLLGDVRLPGAATLSKKQVQLDAALCSHWQDAFTRCRHAVYVWADSSPQAGEDYLMSVLLLIPEPDLVACMESCHMLWSSVRQLRDAAANEDRPALATHAHDRQAASAMLRDKVQLHRQVPCALGSGASNLDYKTRLLCHKCLMESKTPQHAVQLLNQVIGICVDMGVEAGLADVAGATVEQYMDSWYRAPSAQSELQSDAEGDLPQPPKTDAQDLADNFLAANNQFLMPKALISPGMLHIMDTISSNMSSSFPSFEAWLVQLKAIAKLLGRFLQRCLVGRHAHFLVLFKTKLPRIAKWRWGTMYRVLSLLLPLQTALKHTRDAELFLGCDHALLQAKNDDHLDTACISGAVRSHWFWAYAWMMHSLYEWAQAVSHWSESCQCHGWIPNATRGLSGIGLLEPATDATEICLSCLSEDLDGPRHRCVLAGKGLSSWPLGSSTRTCDR